MTRSIKPLAWVLVGVGVLVLTAGAARVPPGAQRPRSSTSFGSVRPDRRSQDRCGALRVRRPGRSVALGRSPLPGHGGNRRAPLRRRHGRHKGTLLFRIDPRPTRPLTAAPKRASRTPSGTSRGSNRCSRRAPSPRRTRRRPDGVRSGASGGRPDEEGLRRHVRSLGDHRTRRTRPARAGRAA